MSESPSPEQQFVINLVFKPKEPGLRLRPAETQLLLAYMGEILREIEEEERLIIAEEKAAEEREGTRSISWKASSWRRSGTRSIRPNISVT